MYSLSDNLGGWYSEQDLKSNFVEFYIIKSTFLYDIAIV